MRAQPVRHPPGSGGLLTAQALTRAFGGIIAVDGVTVSVPPGRISGLIGPNGAGKTTLFDCLSGSLRPTAGRVLLDGRDVTRLPDHARARLGLQRTFQSPAVFAGMTVRDNIRVGAEPGLPARTLLAGLLGSHSARGGADAEAAAGHALRLLGLVGVAGLAAAELPSETLRRVELARALAARPRVLLLDEPAAGLDQAGTGALAAVLRALAAEGMALLLVEHDLDLLFSLADPVWVMVQGRIVAAGPPQRVRAEAAAHGLDGSGGGG